MFDRLKSKARGAAAERDPFLREHLSKRKFVYFNLIAAFVGIPLIR